MAEKEKLDGIALLNAEMARLNKVLGKGTVYEYRNFSGDERERVSSGSLGIDYILGGGYAKGMMHYIIGGTSAGKSTLCLLAIREAQKLGIRCLYADMEYCMSGDSLIYNPTTGNNSTCSELNELGAEFDVLSSVDGVFIPQKATIKSTGSKEIFQVKLEAGTILKLTAEHEVLTQNGYIKVSDLSLDDILYRPATIPAISGVDKYEDEELYFLLGYYLGNGTNLSAKVTPEFCCMDKETIDYLETIINRYDCTVSRKKRGYMNTIVANDDRIYDIDSKEVLTKYKSGWSLEELATYYGIGSTTIKNYLREGLPKNYDFRKHSIALRIHRRPLFDTANDKPAARKTDHNKILEILSKYPETYLNHKKINCPTIFNEKNLAQFISGVIMSDGTVVDVENQHRRSMSISTSSYRFAVDLQSNLLRFGVQTNLNISKKTGYDDSYNVTMNGKSNFDILEKVLNLRSYKGDRFKRACKLTTVSDAVKYDGNRRIQKIKSIESIGQEPVFDISVKNSTYESQNFLCNNTIVHNCLDKNYAESLGVDMDALILTQPNTMEDGYQIILDLIETGEIGLVVYDSLAGALTRAEMEGDVGDQKMAIKARLNSNVFPKLKKALFKHNVIGIMVNQWRNKIISFGDNRSEPGGEAVKYFPDIKLDINQSTKEKASDGEITGNLVRAECTKNKTARPFLKTSYTIHYGSGIDKIGEIFLHGTKTGVIETKGSWYAYDGTNIGQGAPAVIAALADNPDLVEIIEKQIRTHYGI